MNKLNKYISYFQSVSTIGIMTDAENEKQAGEIANLKMLDKNGVNHCYFDQTDFELSTVEEWSPDFETNSVNLTENSLDLNFNLSPRIKNIIATRLQKPMDEMTQEDYIKFIKTSLGTQLKNQEN